jgi:VIT1/CCC1 family predicted Fe2+/Mn2+ transporter
LLSACHAGFWEEKLRAAGAPVPERRPGWRTRLLIAVARRFGTQLVLPTLNDLEQADSLGYDEQPESRGTAMPAEERSHARLLRSLSGGAGVEGVALGRLEGRHRAASGNALRAAVLGANDGLLSNFRLVMGVAGEARGLGSEQARGLATRQIADRSTALDTLAREELGIDPAELGGSAAVAGATSFVLFAIGAIVPVIPYFFLSGTSAVAVSAALSVAGLFTIGALITVFTGRGALFSGGRQVLIGAAAAALTYVVGLLIGGAVGV